MTTRSHSEPARGRANHQSFETQGTGRIYPVTAPADLVARVWMMDLRRKSFSEIGGTSRPREIWQCVKRRIDTDEITDCGAPMVLSPGQAMEVKRRAMDLVTECVALDADAVI
jgi:hypothetical protein